MRRFRAFLAALLIFGGHAAFAVPTNTTTQPIPAGSPVYSGVGAPRAYIDVVDSGSELITDGTNPVLVPWGSVVEISCTALAAGEFVLACFSMHIDGVADQSDGQLSDPDSRDAECHGMFLTPEKPTNDMRLEKSRFLQNGQQYPGAQFVGVCVRPGTAYHGAPCSVAGEATDCGAASTCDVGFVGSSQTRAIDAIAGAWLILDSTAATETCFFRVDI
jgi:hypothetical protein